MPKGISRVCMIHVCLGMQECVHVCVTIYVGECRSCVNMIVSEACCSLDVTFCMCVHTCDNLCVNGMQRVMCTHVVCDVHVVCCGE